MRPSRRLGYRFARRLRRRPATMLNLAFQNRGRLGVGLQARSLTVDRRAATATRSAPATGSASALPNPGTYDLSVHGPNGFFRHFAGSPGDRAAGRGATAETARGRSAVSGPQLR